MQHSPIKAQADVQGKTKVTPRVALPVQKDGHQGHVHAKETVTNHHRGAKK